MRHAFMNTDCLNFVHRLFSLRRENPLHLVTFKKLAFTNVSELVQLVKSGLFHALLADAQCHSKRLSNTVNNRIELIRYWKAEFEISRELLRENWAILDIYCIIVG